MVGHLECLDELDSQGARLLVKVADAMPNDRVHLGGPSLAVSLDDVTNGTPGILIGLLPFLHVHISFDIAG